MTVTPGTTFNTRHEAGCVATSAPDEHGNFIGTDSDGVEVEFNTRMVDPDTLEN